MAFCTLGPIWSRNVRLAAWGRSTPFPHAHRENRPIFQNKGFPLNQCWIMCSWTPQDRWGPPEHPSDTSHAFSASCCRLPIRPVPGTKLSVEDQSSNGGSRVDSTEYRSYVGSLLYAAMTCRPDISYTVKELSRFLVEPLQAHLQAAKHCDYDEGSESGPSSAHNYADDGTCKMHGSS